MEWQILVLKRKQKMKEHGRKCRLRTFLLSTYIELHLNSPSPDHQLKEENETQNELDLLQAHQQKKEKLRRLMMNMMK